MDTDPRPSLSNPRFRRLFIVGGIGLVLLVAVGIVLIAIPRRPPLPCDASTLQIGETKLMIQTLPHKSGDAISVPSGKSNQAYWVEGTNAHYVFGLSPSGQTLSLDQQLKVGDPIRINWGDCSLDEYVVSSLTEKVPEADALLDQSQGGITVFVPKSSSSSGWMIQGNRPELLTPSAAETADPNAAQAEISFLEQSISADGKSLLLKINIKNIGSKSIHLAQSDISLTAGEGAAAQPETAEPTLPINIEAGKSATFMLTFPKPPSNVATLKLLDFSVDLYF